MNHMGCKECESCQTTYRAESTANNRGCLPRYGFSCDHELAVENHRRLFPKTPQTYGFIGFSKKGEVVPSIKGHPQWCPLASQVGNPCEGGADE